MSATSQSTRLAIRRDSDGLYLQTEGNWTADTAMAHTVDRDEAPWLAEHAMHVQEAAGHSFVADVVLV